MQRTAIPKNLGHAARLWEWILLIAWVDQKRNLLIERTLGRKFLLDRTEGRNFFSSEDIGRNLLVLSQRRRGLFKNGFFQKRWTKDGFFSSVGRSRTDSFSRDDRGMLSFSTIEERTEKRILSVAWVDQERIRLEEIAERTILLIIWVEHEWTLQQSGPRDGFSDSYAQSEGRDADSHRIVCRGRDSLRHGLKGCILEVAWVERQKQGVLSGGIFLKQHGSKKYGVDSKSYARRLRRISRKVCDCSEHLFVQIGLGIIIYIR